MKILLDVTKTLLLINGVVVLPSLLLFKSMYQQQYFSMATVAYGNDSPSKFHHHIKDDGSKYQQELEKKKEELELFKAETDSQISELETALKSSQSQKPVNANIATVSSPNLPTPETVMVSQPRQEAQTPKTVLAKQVSTVSSPKPKRERAEVSENITRKAEPVKPAQKTVLPDAREVNNSSPATKPSQSQNKESTVYPKEFLSHSESQRAVNPLAFNQTVNNYLPRNQESITLASLLHEGLVIADNKNQINPGTTNYKKVRKAIDTLKNGESRTLYQAARSSGIATKVLVRVKEWGEDYSQSRQLSHDIQLGLIEADKQKHVRYGTRNYRKVQTAVVSLRNGTSIDLADAARRSGIDSSVLTQLADWGKERRTASQISRLPNWE